MMMKYFMVGWGRSNGLSILAVFLAVAGCERRIPEPKVELHNALIIPASQPDGDATLHFSLETNNDPTKLIAITTSQGARFQMSSKGGPIDPNQLVFSPTMPLKFDGEPVALVKPLDTPVGGFAEVIFHLEPTGQLKAKIRVIPSIPPTAGDPRFN
ncbi:hypothetical protein [Blastomonas sp.]|uniref:hypothetical protein n=1 Tax=Blastomonas sp. TaxID=1909299 RepID=UPI003593F126